MGVRSAPVNFSREVLPVLSEHCFQCHGPDEKARKGGLRLDVAEGVLRTNRAGMAIVAAGRPESSEVVRRLGSRDPEEVMPPPSVKRRVTEAEAEVIRRWIAEGAGWGRHWAFEVPVPGVLPPVSNRGWVRTPIDRHVLARLEREGLSPSAEAGRETLVRRVFLDLTGLPPSPEERARAMSAEGPAWYEELVERLLASPPFGERMAWDWLDAARYADSNGYQGDGERTMWPWRDWVVGAFNGNLPFDAFTVWQLAGDLLREPTQEQRLATGFCRNHMINGEGGRIPEENRIDYVMEMTETMGTVWLGLTLNCARCHDHKYDPVTQREYYGLFAFFNQTPVTGGGGDPQTRPILDVLDAGEARRRSELGARRAEAEAAVGRYEAGKLPIATGSGGGETGVGELPREIREILQLEPGKRETGKLDALVAHWKTADPVYVRELERLKEAREAWNRHVGSTPKVMVMEDRAERRETHVLSKGLYDRPREVVGAGTPASLPGYPEGQPTNRLGLARWLVAREQPLTARVVVNRFWQQFFGVGLVKTTEDFGVQGEAPVHGALLDWLAARFVESGWDVKALCRMIVTSATYRQGSSATAERMERDPQNRLYARGARFRLPSWMLRDQALAAAGLLSPRLGGRPVNAYQPPGVWEEATFGGKKYVQGTGEDLWRRSLYTFWRRIIAPTLFFDNASRQTCSVKVQRTNTPLQALTTLNDVTYVEAARALAARVLSEPGSEARGRLDEIFLRILCRRASEAEAAVLLEGLERGRRAFELEPALAASLLGLGEAATPCPVPQPVLAAYTVLCATVFNLDEALTHE